MNEPIKDITPEHHPIAMLRNAMPMAENSTAGVVILLGKDGEMYWEHCGVNARDLLWALECMKAKLMSGESHIDG